MGWKGILGFDYGVVQAPLGPDISGPELAAAVANAGAIGLLRLPDWPAPEHVRELIRRTRGLTEKPFGAAIVLAFPHEENLRVVLEEKLAVLQVYWGEFPKERVDEAHRAGVKVLHQVGNLEEAAKAKEAGVDGIIVQGREAGGHVIGQEGLLPLLPRVVDLVLDSTVLVIAAGGIVEGRGYAAALALGAHGVCLGQGKGPLHYLHRYTALPPDGPCLRRPGFASREENGGVRPFRWRAWGHTCAHMRRGRPPTSTTAADDDPRHAIGLGRL